MEIQSAFDLVADKVEKALAEQDYKRQNVDSQLQHFIQVKIQLII
jgi:hypothetical protein